MCFSSFGGIINKKRLRYKTNARILAAKHGLTVDLEDWEQVWDVLAKYEEPTYLYFIGQADITPGMKEVKIGRSKNPGQRLKALQTAYPHKLYLYCFCEEKSPYTEKEVHRKWKHLRTIGEWFILTPELSEFIRELKDKQPQYR